MVSSRLNTKNPAFTESLTEKSDGANTWIYGWWREITRQVGGKMKKGFQAWFPKNSKGTWQRVRRLEKGIKGSDLAVILGMEGQWQKCFSGKGRMPCDLSLANGDGVGYDTSVDQARPRLTWSFRWTLEGGGRITKVNESWGYYLSMVKNSAPLNNSLERHKEFCLKVQSWKPPKCIPLEWPLDDVTDVRKHLRTDSSEITTAQRTQCDDS